MSIAGGFSLGFSNGWNVHKQLIDRFFEMTVVKVLTGPATVRTKTNKVLIVASKTRVTLKVLTTVLDTVIVLASVKNKIVKVIKAVLRTVRNP